MKKPVPVDKVTAGMLKRHPIWEFVSESDDRDETFVTVVEHLPVRTLRDRLVATRVRLNNGASVLALLGNIDLRDPTSNEHFRTVTVFDSKGRRFELARYHDSDFRARSPKRLAEFLRLQISDVFPMSYDISGVARGAESCRKGVIDVKPRKRFTQKQLIALALR